MDAAGSSRGPASEGDSRKQTAFREDVGVAVVLLLVGVAALIWTVRQGMPFRVALFPRIAASGMVLCSLALGVRATFALRGRDTAERDRGGPGATVPTEDSEAADTPSAIGAWGLVGGTVVYVVLLSAAGFVVSTALCMAIGMVTLGYRRPIRVAAITVGFTAGAHWLFFRVLNVPDLPLVWPG